MPDRNLSNPTPNHLPATQISLVEALRSESDEHRHEGLECFARLYEQGIRAYIRAALARRRGQASHDDIEEILQNFMLNRVLKPGMLDGYDPAKGSLRARVLHMLKWEIAEHFRTRKLDQKRQHLNDEQSLDDFAAESSQADEHLDRVYHEALLREAITRASHRMREEYRAKGRGDIWTIFELRELRPKLDQTDPPAYDATFMTALGVGSPTQAANLLVQGKRAFRRHMKQVIVEMGVAPGEEQTEIRAMLGEH